MTIYGRVATGKSTNWTKGLHTSQFQNEREVD